jgi:hypothetical protein
MRELLAEADANAKRVTIHVERFNRALRLYERLGFAPVDDRASISSSSDDRLCEDGLVALADTVRAERNEEDVEKSELAVLDPVDALRQRRIWPSPEDERERSSRSGSLDALGDLDQLDFERRRLVGRDPKPLAAERRKGRCRQRVEGGHADEA